MKNLFGFILAGLLLALGAGAALGQTLTSDQADYEPGTLATLQGAGFQPGEEVHLLVLHADGTPATGVDHAQWSVVADQAGNFTAIWHVCEDDCVGSQLRATADGAGSGLHAEVLFWDSVTAVAIVSPAAFSMTPITSLPATVPVSITYSTSGTVLTSASVTILGSVSGNSAGRGFIVPTGANLSATLSVTIPVCTSQGIPWEPGENLLVTVRVTNSSSPSPTFKFSSAPDAYSLGTPSSGTWLTIACASGVVVSPNAGSDWVGALPSPAVSGACGVVNLTSDAPPSFPPGMTTVRWTALDDIGVPVQCVQTVTVTGASGGCSAPLLACDPAVTFGTNVGCAYDGPIAPPSVTNGCEPVSLTHNAPAAFPLGVTTLTWTATDAQGHVVTCPQTVTVVDDDRPVITLLGDNPATVECGSGPYADPGATASDVCAGILTVSPGRTKLNMNITGSYSVDYFVSDGNGNSATASRTVIVVDTQPPVVSLNGGTNLTVECHGSFVDPGASATDACAGPLPVAGSGSVNADVLGNYTLTYTATDPNGYVGTASRTVRVADTAPPVVTAPGSIMFPVCEYAPSLVGGATASDECSGLLAATASGVPAAGAAVGTYTVTWSATDPSGNTGTASQLITIGYGDVQGFLSPMMPAPTPILVKKGRTVPVKFALSTCAGLTTAIANISVTQLPGLPSESEMPLEPLGTSAADIGTRFRYAGDSGHYQFNLGTSNMAVNKSYRIRATLADGQTIDGFVTVNK